MSGGRTPSGPTRTTPPHPSHRSARSSRTRSPRRTFDRRGSLHYRRPAAVTATPQRCCTRQAFGQRPAATCTERRPLEAGQPARAARTLENIDRALGGGDGVPGNEPSEVRAAESLERGVRREQARCSGSGRLEGHKPEPFVDRWIKHGRRAAPAAIASRLLDGTQLDDDRSEIRTCSEKRRFVTGR